MMDFEQKETANGVSYSPRYGFSTPTPPEKAEKRAVRMAGNGIGLACLGYVVLSSFVGSLLFVLSDWISVLFQSPVYFADTEVGYYTLTILIYVVSLLLPFGLYALTLKIPFKTVLPFRKSPLSLTVSGAMVAFGTAILAGYLTRMLSLALTLFGIVATEPELYTPTTTVGKIAYLLTTVLLPAFIEEIAFRGFLLQSLRRFGDTFALILSALTFGVFHMNLVQAPYAFLMGLCIGYFVLRTGSLWVGVWIHLVNNGLVTLLELLSPVLSPETYLLLNVFYNVFALLVGLLGVLLLVKNHEDSFSLAPSPSVLSPGERAKAFLLSPGMLLALLVAAVSTVQTLETLW